MTLIPSHLQAITEAAQVAMLHHPQYDLNLGYRHAICAALERDGDEHHQPGPHSYRRHVNLLINTIQHVLPIWEHTMLDDKTPHQLLVQAIQVLDGVVKLETARRTIDYFITYIDNLNLYEANQNVIAVVEGAVVVLSVAVASLAADPQGSTLLDEADYAVTDADVDPYEHDAVFFAAVAYAGGPPWDPRSNPTRRKEFWEWWLTDAVPAAWASVP